jgi:hypothetical protein
MTYRFHPKALGILGVAAALFSPGLRAQEESPLAWPPITAQTRPWARWWWMGNAVDPANLDRELARYQAAGLGGVEVTPIYGVKGWEDRAIPYLSPRWMEMLDHAIETGARLGLETDMTTGTGWCFGGPTVTGSDANAVIVAATQDVPPGATLTGTFDPATTQALVAFSADGKCEELTDRIRPDGSVGWTAAGGPWHVYAISQKPSGTMVKRAAPGCAGPMLNLFFPGAMTRYLQWFQEPFATARPKLRSLFQDSYEYNSQWAPDFFARFEKLRGYRLERELPALLGTATDDHAARVKCDYRETISDIMTIESIPIWVQWAHAHGYLARYQAHGDPGNLLDLYADADIPETEMFHLDHNILTSKFASSAAHVTGKNLASAETGTWLAEHFTETLAEMKYLVDDMFLAGINHIVYHGTAYSPDSAPWPGWCFYASAEMNPRNSIWRDVPALNGYVARCQSILQSGASDNDVLLYWPIHDRWSDPGNLVRSFGIGGKTWFESQPIGPTAHRLWDGGFAFDYISDRQLAAIKSLDQGRLILGGCRYRAIVVPPCHLMPVETLRQLLSLASRGITVIFDGKLPDDVPGWANLESRRRQFKSLLHVFQSTASLDPFYPPPVAGDVETMLAAAGVSRESAIASLAGVHFVRRSYGGGLLYFIANRGAQPLDRWTTLSTRASSVELMDPMTGRTGLAHTRIADEGNTQVHLRLEPGESILVRTFASAVETGPAWPLPEPDGTPAILAGAWTVNFIDGGPALPAPVRADKLDSWTSLGGPAAQSFAGTALYTLAFDAPQGRTGPCSIDLGKVCQSARVRLNGKPLGTVFIPPFRVEAASLLPRGNVLEVEVTNTSANRVRDLDIRHVPWKIFSKPNVLNVSYKPFDASGWPLTDSGLMGPVTITPEKIGEN